MTVPGFETTCPECGNVFDVDADAERASCPGCGVVLEFDDAPSEAAGPGADEAAASLRQDAKAVSKHRAEPAATSLAEQLALEQAAFDRQRQLERDEQERRQAAEERERRRLEDQRRREADRERQREERQRLAAERQAAREAQRRQRGREREDRLAERTARKDEVRRARMERERARNDGRLRRHAQKRAAQPIRATAKPAAVPAAAPERSEPRGARDRFLTRDRVHGKPVPVVEVEGIGPAYEKRLAAEGVRTTRDLLDADGAALAQATGIPPRVVRRWQDMAELMAVPGIGKQYAEVLSRCGVQTVSDLARREAGTLHGLIQADLESVGVTITKARLSPKLVQKWIDAAAAIRPPAPSEGAKALAAVQAPPRTPSAGPEAEAARRAKQAAVEQRRAEQEARQRLRAAEAQKRAADAEAARKARAEAATKRQQERDEHRRAREAQRGKGGDGPRRARAPSPPMESVSCPHCDHAFNTRAGRRKVTCPKCHSRLLLLAPDEADPTQAKRLKRQAREAARREQAEARRLERAAKAEALAKRRAEVEAARRARAEAPGREKPVKAKPAETRPAKTPKSDAEAVKTRKAEEGRDRGRERERERAEREAAKRDALQGKEDERVAQALAKDLSVDVDLARQMVKAGIRSLEDLAKQDAHALFEKLGRDGA